ncbi:DUF6776 family protein [Shewanella youngdeokensis]|uniref:DUF6776 family protein n=1 Tax=Shewanella youngdeokensis TaxID=2999068 RepID=A0ABZ0JVP1_9GAMM|nr:DUF6776 family protein [Shewanella sp. DAU334]
MSKYHRWLDRMQVIERQFRTSSVYLFLLVVASITLGALSFDVATAYLTPKVEPAADKTEQYTSVIKAQADTLAARNIELALEREANANMQAMFVEQQGEQQKLARELAFYRSVMAPENIADGIVINSLALSPALLPNQYKFKLVLTQLEKRKRSISGRSEVTFVGLQEGKATRLELADLIDSPLKFKFRYFQILEAEITLPENFILSNVIAKVVVPSSRWTKGSQAKQEFNAQDLLVNENEQSIVLEQNGQVLDNSAQ